MKTGTEKRVGLWNSSIGKMETHDLVYLRRDRLVSYWKNNKTDEIIMIGDHNGLGTWTVWYDYGEHIHGPVVNWGYKDARPDAKDDRYVYSIPSYTEISPKETPDAWRTFRAIKELWIEHEHAHFSKRISGDMSPSDVCFAFVDVLEQDTELSPYAPDFYSLAYAGRNYGHNCTFDVRKCNFAADDKGGLSILPMVLIDLDQLR